MDYLRETIRIARLAGDHIRAIREKNRYTLHLKEHDELVTSADLESNDIIKSEILKIFPLHTYISEEEYQGQIIDIEAPTWIVDPIDGTVGYANGHYQVGISIAFVKDNRVQVGVVYNPFLDEMFFADEHGGAYLNDRPIRVSERRTLKQSVIGTGIPHNRDDLADILSDLADILPKIRDIRRLGSPALDICWVACGRLQGFYEAHLYPWDVTAARFIAVMAGASVGQYRCNKTNDRAQIIDGKNVIVAAPSIFDDLMEILNN